MTDAQYAKAAKATAYTERFRRTTIGLVAMIKHDIEGPGYGQPERPNWHSLQVFILLRGDGMLLRCDEFLQLVLGLPEGEERSELLKVLGGPEKTDEYIDALSDGEH
ncbi:hypothetical protein LCGC14_1058690 [marine sediment metagenome]|uniref:Uncharacterized protein n=1 Tax=marine sediment metagenome TaxID=412755 RepID=A0A0F9MLX2_9ZZZZ